MSAVFSLFGQAVTEIKQKQHIPSTGKDQRAELKCHLPPPSLGHGTAALQYAFPHRDTGQKSSSASALLISASTDVQRGFFH